MAKATKETCVETVNQDQSETRGYWYLLVTCKSAFYHLYQYLYMQKNIWISIFQRRNEESPWSDDLPEEVLGLIKLHLFGQDYCSFCAVCKTWRSKGNPFPLHITPSKSMTQSPWLVYLEAEDHVLNVFHPLFKGSVIEIPRLLSDSRICTSNDGWLLMWQYSRRVFFLNPFNKTMIELPDFPRQEWDLFEENEKWSYHLPAFSFSSPPTSANCIVFGIAKSHWAEEVSICIIRHGEASWTIHNSIANNLPFMLSNANPVFHNGLVYCLGEDGNLGVFDPHKNTKEECNWTVLDRPHAPSFVSTIPDGNRFLVPCNGNLFSVFHDHMGEDVSVFNLDHQTMIWNQVQDLEDHTLFLTSQTSLSVKIDKAFGGMGDKIYFPIFPFSSCDSSSNRGSMINSCSCVFYSLRTDMYHSFGTSHSSLDISGTKIWRNCAWIEPNFVIPSSKDLKWGLKSSVN